MSVPILIAEDDADDRSLIAEAFDECGSEQAIEFVTDGEELLEYLRCQGKYQDRRPSGDPLFVLLDLNMPRKDGRLALEEIKQDPKLRRIPVVVLTTSEAEDDILRTYELGVSSYITKPFSFDALINVVKVLSRYWLETVTLPPTGQRT